MKTTKPRRTINMRVIIVPPGGHFYSGVDSFAQEQQLPLELSQLNAFPCTLTISHY